MSLRTWFRDWLNAPSATEVAEETARMEKLRASGWVSAKLKAEEIGEGEWFRISSCLGRPILPSGELSPTGERTSEEGLLRRLFLTARTFVRRPGDEQ